MIARSRSKALWTSAQAPLCAGLLPVRRRPRPLSVGNVARGGSRPRLICSTSRWRESPVSRELRSCAVVGAKAWRRASLANGPCAVAWRRYCGARTPPSASPSTPHLGPRPGMRTRSSAHQELEPADVAEVAGQGTRGVGGEHAFGASVSVDGMQRGGHLAQLDAAPGPFQTWRPLHSSSPRMSSVRANPSCC